MVSPTGPVFSRRALLLGAAGAVILTSCGGDDDTSADSITTTETARSASLIQFFGNDHIVAGREQRLPFGLGDTEGVITREAPATLAFQLLDDTGGEVGGPITVGSRQAGLPRPYFAVPVTLPAPGIYTATTSWNGQSVEASFEVVAETSLPQVGEPLPRFDTPTTADTRGVNPICTAEPQCPLHDVTLSAALASGAPVALLISTPKFCQVKICGPVLDVLLSQRDAFPGIRMLHAEVYTDETTSTTTDAVQSLGLTFEPCLFLAGSDGTVAARLDNIYDQTELVAALTALS
ncbi:MAG: hypothetical protein ACRD0U_21010 [Acidimicrobiales bacterium]